MNVTLHSKKKKMKLTEGLGSYDCVKEPVLRTFSWIIWVDLSAAVLWQRGKGRSERKKRRQERDEDRVADLSDTDIKPGNGSCPRSWKRQGIDSLLKPAGEVPPSNTFISAQESAILISDSRPLDCTRINI